MQLISWNTFRTTLTKRDRMCWHSLYIVWITMYMTWHRTTIIWDCFRNMMKRCRIWTPIMIGSMAVIIWWFVMMIIIDWSRISRVIIPRYWRSLLFRKKKRKMKIGRTRVLLLVLTILKTNSLSRLFVKLILVKILGSKVMSIKSSRLLDPIRAKMSMLMI